MSAVRGTSEESITPADTFDAATNTWTLRGHAAVAEALACPSLAAGHEPLRDAAESPSAIRTAVRAAARDAFPAARLIAWRARLEASARRLAANLPADAPVDLMEAFAAPWSLDVAISATRTHSPMSDGAHLVALARTIFLDAARTTTGDVTAPAREAATALAMALSSRDATQTIDVQSFVALSQTLPHLLAAAWGALLADPGALRQWQWLDNKSAAISELLRFSGPSRAVFRRAQRDTRIGALFIASGQRVILMLDAANHDPRVFPDGDRLDLARDASRHVAFGGGAHACVGKPIISLALDVATTALCDRLCWPARIESVQWLEGFAIRAPSSLITTLSS